MDDLQRMIEGADPIRGSVEPDVVQASVQMAHQTAEEPRGARRGPVRWWSGRKVAALAVVAMAVPTTAYAADRFLAQTGVHRAASTENDTSEVIDLCAPDFAKYVKSLPHPKDPAPAGMTWDQIADRVIAWETSAPGCGPGELGAETFATGIKNMFFMTAGSIFVCRAVREHDSGHEQAAARDARQFATMLDRSDQLGTWGDEGWKKDRAAALSGDWTHLRAADAANGARPCP